jgi:N12 class adenine-specific DNA methylase
MGRYGGWGAADAVFAPGASGNDLRDRERLRAVLTRLGGSGEAGERLFRSAGLTVLNAHYTDPMLVGAIYQALAKLGLDRGTVVEPGAGSGQFAAFAPAGIRITGVELDQATALIAQLLHPDAEILTGSVSDPRFARVRDQSAAPVRVPRDAADGFVGNVPFSDVKWPDEVLNPGTRFSLHDHAIRWGVTRVAPGGLCAFITSRYTADAVNPRFRRTLAGELDLIGMVRLPSTAHKRMAGTSVVTDIIIGRRIADGERPLTSPETWEQSRPLATPGSSQPPRVNTYFHDNPQHVLGTLQAGGMYRAGDFTVAPSGDLEQQLGAALGEITGRALAAGQRHQPRPAGRPVIEILSRRPDGTVTAKPDGTFTQVVHGQDVPLAISGEREADQTRKLVALAEARSALISAEASCPEDTDEIDVMRARMGELYDAYTAAYGPIGRFTTRTVNYSIKTLEGVLDRLDFSRKDVPDPEVTLLETYLGRDALTRIVRSAANPEQVRHGTRKDKQGETVATVTQLVETARVRAALTAALAQVPQGADADTLTATFSERMSRIETGEQRTRLMPAAFRSDPRRPAVEALETFDPVTQTAVKKAVFSRRTAMPHRMELGADTPQEALDLVLIHRRRVDLGEIARLLGTDEADARAQLGTLVFDESATGNLVAAGEYLSGNVREKLAAARTAAAGDPERYTANVENLEAVQPPALAAEDIQARLGSAWLSREIVQQGLRHVLEDPRLTVIHPGGSEWKVESRTARNSRAQDTYGTSDWNALDLAGALLTNASITVRRTYIDPVTGTERSYRDDGATLFAFRKAQRLDADFVSWLWSDPERADECVRLYNNAYNNQVKRVWDASPFYIPGLAPGMKLHPFQSAMVRRLHTESGLGAWVVGAGKTELGIVAAMEGARLGRHQLTAIVTPASLVNQWRDRIYRTFPEARVLIADDDLRGRRDSRAVFTERAASGDYQLAITPYEFFGSLPLSGDAARASVDEEIDKLTRYAQEAAAQGDRSTAKDLQGKIARLEAKHSAEVKASGGASGFTDTGIDSVVVDEWHNFRRIRRDSNNRLLAMSGSARANHMLAVFDYLRKHHPEGLLLGLSGTPLEQSIADAWAAMRFFTPGRLKELGLEEFDAFLTTFGRTEPRREPTPTGSGLHVRERQADWFNLPDMRRTLWDPFADVVRRADLGLNLPRLTGGRPQTHVLPQTPGQAHMQADIDHRYEMFKAGNRKGDNHILKLMDQAGKNALHPRMLGMDTDGKIKIEVWADAAAAWYHATKDAGFLDREGNPHPVPGALRMVACELGVPDPARPNAWSVYSEMRSLLAARGVPAGVIRFAQDADSDRKKAALWEDARTGRCNFVIGSAQTAGTGVDVPDRLQVLDYMTLSWNPTQFEQWLGRIVRQGNQNPEVAAHVWATEGTIEVLRADKIAMKSAPFEALLDGTSETRHLTEEDDNPISAWAAEMTARMSGNPLLTAQREAQLDVDTAQGMQNEWQRENGVKARRLAVMDKEIKELEAENAAIDDALSRAVDTRGNKFAARVGTRRYTVRAEAGAALVAALTATAVGDVSTLTGGNPQHLAELAGFQVTARYNRVTLTMPTETADEQDAGQDAEPAERTLITLGLESVPQGQVSVIDATDLPGRDPAALITSLEDRIRRLPGYRAKNTAAIADNRDQIAKTRAELAQPSPYLQQLADARDALDRIEAQISEQITDDNPESDAAVSGADGQADHSGADATTAPPAASGPPGQGLEPAATGNGPPPASPAPAVQAGHPESTTLATPAEAVSPPAGHADPEPPAAPESTVGLGRLAAAHGLAAETVRTGGTLTTTVHDGARTVLLHDDITGTWAGGQRLDPGEVPPYLAAYASHPQLPPRCLADLARHHPGEPASLTLTAARETAARHGLEVRIRRVGGQSYITFCEPGAAAEFPGDIAIPGLPVLSYQAGADSARHGPCTVPVAAIGSYLAAYRENVPPAMFTVPERYDWRRRVAPLTPHLIEGSGHFIPAARDRVRAALAAARDDRAAEARALLAEAEALTPVPLLPEREAELTAVVHRDTARYRHAEDPAASLATTSLRDLDVTARELDWVRAYIAGHPEIREHAGETGPAAGPDSDREAATGLAQQAQEASNRGDYQRALALIDEIELLRPSGRGYDAVRDNVRAAMSKADGANPPGRQQPQEPTPVGGDHTEASATVPATESPVADVPSAGPVSGTDTDETAVASPGTDQAGDDPGTAAPAGPDQAGRYTGRIRISFESGPPTVSGTSFDDPAELREALRANFTWRKRRQLWEYTGRSIGPLEAVASIRSVLARLDRESAAPAVKELPPTPQQQAILDAFLGGKDIAVQALAGTGKTTTLVLLARALMDRSPEVQVVYTAFNADIVADARRGRFDRNVTAMTMHSIARQALLQTSYAGKVNGGDQGARWPEQWASVLEITDVTAPGSAPVPAEEIARLVIATVRKFRESADDEPGRQHLPGHLSGAAGGPLARAVLSHARKAWADIADPGNTALLAAGRALRVDHDDYLKVWALSRPRVNAGVIFFDEAQDVNAVMRRVILDQAAQTIVVGDSHQSIYGFRGAIDALKDWPADIVLPLTQSWRFGPAAAEFGNLFLRSLGSSLLLEGNPALDTRLGSAGEPDAILCRTNATAVAEVFNGLEAGKSVALAGGGQAIREIAKAARDLQSGRGTKHPDLSRFADWDEVRHYAQHDEDGKSLQVFVRLVDRHGPGGLIDMIGRLTPEGDPSNPPQLTISTAHKAKGRQWPRVRIAGDFRGPVTDPDTGEVTWPAPEERRLAYVAATRAQLLLETGSLSWIRDYPEPVGSDQARASELVGMTTVATASQAATADPASQAVASDNAAVNSGPGPGLGRGMSAAVTATSDQAAPDAGLAIGEVAGYLDAHLKTDHPAVAAGTADGLAGQRPQPGTGPAHRDVAANSAAAMAGPPGPENPGAGSGHDGEHPSGAQPVHPATSAAAPGDNGSAVKPAGIRISRVTVLHGYTSPETAYVVDDYPYSRTLRCKIRYWLETADKGQYRGQVRQVHQTTNPKLSGERWNKPHPERYSAWSVMYVNEDGHVKLHSTGEDGPRGSYDALIRLDGTYEQLTADERAAYDQLVERARRGSRWDSWYKALDLIRGHRAEHGILPAALQVSAAASGFYLDDHESQMAVEVVAAGLGGVHAGPGRPAEAPSLSISPVATAQEGAASPDTTDSLPEAGAAPDGSPSAEALQAVSAAPAAADGPGQPAARAKGISELVPPRLAAQAAARHAARLGRICYLYRAPARGSLSQRMVSTAVPPLVAGYLAVTPDGTWTEHWRGQDRPLEAPDGELAPEYPLTLTEARTIAGAAGLEVVITRVAERSFISLAEPGATTAPLYCFEAGGRDVFAGRAIMTPGQSIGWLDEYRRAMDAHAREANGSAYTIDPGIDEWACRIAHLAPHLVPGPDYRRRVWETLATAVTLARRGDADAASRLLKRAETEAAPLALSPGREAALIGKITEDAPRWHRIPGADTARYIANREAVEPGARATWREEDWIRQYIDRHQDVLMGPIVTSDQRNATVRAQRQRDLDAASTLAGQVKAAFADGRYAEALALIDDAELRAPDGIPGMHADTARATVIKRAGPRPADPSVRQVGAALDTPAHATKPQEAAGPAPVGEAAPASAPDPGATAPDDGAAPTHRAGDAVGPETPETTPANNSDLAIALRRLPGFTRLLTQAGTPPHGGTRDWRPDGEPDAGAYQELDSDPNGIEITIRGPGFTRHGRLAWPQVAGWIDAGVTPARLGIIITADRLSMFCRTRHAALAAAGRCDPGAAASELDQIRDDTIRMVVDTALRTRGAAAPVPPGRPGKPAYYTAAMITYPDPSASRAENAALERLAELRKAIRDPQPITAEEVKAEIRRWIGDGLPGYVRALGRPEAMRAWISRQVSGPARRPAQVTYDDASGRWHGASPEGLITALGKDDRAETVIPWQEIPAWVQPGITSSLRDRLTAADDAHTVLSRRRLTAAAHPQASLTAPGDQDDEQATRTLREAIADAWAAIEAAPPPAPAQLEAARRTYRDTSPVQEALFGDPRQASQQRSKEQARPASSPEPAESRPAATATAPPQPPAPGTAPAEPGRQQDAPAPAPDRAGTHQGKKPGPAAPPQPPGNGAPLTTDDILIGLGRLPAFVIGDLLSAMDGSEPLGPVARQLAPWSGNRQAGEPDAGARERVAAEPPGLHITITASSGSRAGLLPWADLADRLRPGVTAARRQVVAQAARTALRFAAANASFRAVGEGNLAAAAEQELRHLARAAVTAMLSDARRAAGGHPARPAGDEDEAGTLQRISELAAALPDRRPQPRTPVSQVGAGDIIGHPGYKLQPFRMSAAPRHLDSEVEITGRLTAPSAGEPAGQVTFTLPSTRNPDPFVSLIPLPLRSLRSLFPALSSEGSTSHGEVLGPQAGPGAADPQASDREPGPEPSRQETHAPEPAGQAGTASPGAMDEDTRPAAPASGASANLGPPQNDMSRITQEDTMPPSPAGTSREVAAASPMPDEPGTPVSPPDAGEPVSERRAEGGSRRASPTGQPGDGTDLLSELDRVLDATIERRRGAGRHDDGTHDDFTDIRAAFTLLRNALNIDSLVNGYGSRPAVAAAPGQADAARPAPEPARSRNPAPSGFDDLRSAFADLRSILDLPAAGRHARGSDLGPDESASRLLDQAVEEAQACARWYRDTPEWQRITSIGRAAQELIGAIREAARDYWAEIRQDIRVRGFTRTLAARVCLGVSGAAHVLASRLEQSGRGNTRTWRAAWGLHRTTATYADRIMRYTPPRSPDRMTDARRIIDDLGARHRSGHAPAHAGDGAQPKPAHAPDPVRLARASFTTRVPRPGGTPLDEPAHRPAAQAAQRHHAARRT